jgi:RNA polymerase-binding transcription factor DksA
MYSAKDTGLRGIPFLSGACEAWGRLHTEREDVCEALLMQARAVRSLGNGRQDSDASGEDTTRDLEWSRRERLQARLRQIDDALDRLMAGAHGRCSSCGSAIESDRLTNDPAVPRCLICQKDSERGRTFRTL